VGYLFGSLLGALLAILTLSAALKLAFDRWLFDSEKTSTGFAVITATMATTLIAGRWDYLLAGGGALVAILACWSSGWRLVGLKKILTIDLMVIIVAVLIFVAIAAYFKWVAK
jgi:hypothetical protein